MKLNLLQKGSYGLIFGLTLVLVFILAEVGNIRAFDKPAIPALSLTGVDSRWDESWYPDGRVWLPASLNSPREFLLPVFIQNRWHTYDQTASAYQADPIYSFQFSVLYDSSALRAVGVQKFGPRDLGYDPYAKEFNLTWMDNKDWSYKTFLNPNTPYQDYTKGRAIRIVGTSTKPLPNTDLQAEEWKVLLYIRFRVIPKDGVPWGTAGLTPIYVKNDTIKYNNLNIREHAPFEKLRPEYNGRLVGDDYPNPGEFTGLAGVTNRDNVTKWSIEPYLPGTIYLRISDKVPSFDFKLERGIGLIPALEMLQPDLWNLRDPITVDSGSFNPVTGKRVFQLLNGVSTSRLLDVTIESNEPWLLFNTKQIGTNSKNPIPAPVRFGYINWIDNGILGDAARGTPIAGVETPPDPDLHIEIRCDPIGLGIDQDPNREAAGVYVGYLTFRSNTAFIDPVRMRITFIYFRNPVEWYTTTKSAGIHLSILNSKPPVSERTELIFGTGARATIGVDSLFGEYAYEYAMRNQNPPRFNARFFPPPNASDSIKTLVQFGFGDFSSNDEQPRSGSRDIRSVNDTTQSIIYLVRILEDTAAYYPLLLEWDVSDFPPDAQLFLRDTLNGTLFPAVNMRQATNIGGTIFGYTIQDARVKSFYIEYTLPRVITLKDENGYPIIKEGWNLLSLPRRPANPNYTVVYPNAMNKPYYFSQNQYQDEILLRVGVGYFIKYSKLIDTQFVGTYISQITRDLDAVKLYPGWNTIGCVSRTMNVNDIKFDDFSGELPTLPYVRKYGFWGYKTNRGYVEVSEILPGFGYWLKVDNHGYLRLIAPPLPKFGDNGANVKDNILSMSDQITVRDNAQNEGILYSTRDRNVDLTSFEMPPAPPKGLFDLRFNNNANLTNLTGIDNSVMMLNGISYPVSINIQNPELTYTFIDALTGQTFGTIEKGKAGSVVIDKSSNAIKVLTSTANDNGFGFSLNTYPNPVLNSAKVNFSIPENSNVTIKLYDELGNVVMTIADGFYNKGESTVTLDAANLASGSYICKLVTGANTTVQSIRVTR